MKTTPLADYYNARNEETRLDSKHSHVEFLTTMHYINRYIKPGDKVIEIGAGTGRYSRAIAGMSYTIEAVELFKHNIDIFKTMMQPGQNINITQANALDLSAYPDASFDITLSLGPMYHLYTPEDKRQAISEALRITKPGGVVFVAYIIGEPAIVMSGFQHKRFDIKEFLRQGKIDPITFATTSTPEDIFELVRTADIDYLMQDFNVTRLHYVAANLFSHYIGQAIDEMDDEMFELYLRYHYAICERGDLVGISNHCLDIFMKAEK